MRRFSLYRRGRIWYAAFYNPTTKRYADARSTGEAVRSAAVTVVDRWDREGIPERTKRRPVIDTLGMDTILATIRQTELTTKDAERVVAALRDRGLVEYAVMRNGPATEELVIFLERFWDFEKSPYIREKLSHGHRMGRRHAYDKTLAVRSYWKPYFKERKLGELRRNDVRDFSLWLKDKGLASKTINNVLAAGTVPLAWAAENGDLPSNPARGLAKFSGGMQKRGVLTDDEVRRLFASSWMNERAYVGNLLAMSTGLRLGEILAVQVRDIAEDRLHVRHSWSEQDRLKGTKTGEERTVPLLQEVRRALLELARKNPHGVGPATFVFFSTELPDRPMDGHPLVEELKNELIRMRLTEEERKSPAKLLEASEYWKSRRVVFHSWRHYYAARMADRLELRKVQSVTGHRSSAMAEHYADHAAEETFTEVRNVAAETFGTLLRFWK